MVALYLSSQVSRRVRPLRTWAPASLSQHLGGKHQGNHASSEPWRTQAIAKEHPSHLGAAAGSSRCSQFITVSLVRSGLPNTSLRAPGCQLQKDSEGNFCCVLEPRAGDCADCTLQHSHTRGLALIAHLPRPSAGAYHRNRLDLDPQTRTVAVQASIRMPYGKVAS